MRSARQVIEHGVPELERRKLAPAKFDDLQSRLAALLPESLADTETD